MRTYHSTTRRSANQQRPVAVHAAGEPMDTATRSFMESRFQHDFSKVRVHADDQADQSAQTAHALAYTIGTDIVFAKGRYEPRSAAGRRLLAHELAHVLQQTSTNSYFMQRLATPQEEAKYATPFGVPDPLAAYERETYDSSTDEAIESLDLTATAKAGAQALKKTHPDIVFTSGRRTVAEQASAMASNIVASKNRNWIRDVPYLGAAPLQKWVDDNPQAVTKAQIAAGLEATMNALPETERAKVSKHLTGQAFDVQPQTGDAAKIKADMRALPGLSKFLERESGLVRWHAQFKRTRDGATNDKLEREADLAAEYVAG